MSFAAHRGLASYRQVEVQSRTPLELVTMLYDGAQAPAPRFLIVDADAPRADAVSDPMRSGIRIDPEVVPSVTEQGVVTGVMGHAFFTRSACPGRTYGMRSRKSSSRPSPTSPLQCGQRSSPIPVPIPCTLIGSSEHFRTSAVIPSGPSLRLDSPW